MQFFVIKFPDFCDADILFCSKLNYFFLIPLRTDIARFNKAPQNILTVVVNRECEMQLAQ